MPSHIIIPCQACLMKNVSMLTKYFPNSNLWKCNLNPSLSTIMHSCRHDIMIELAVTMNTPCSAIHWQSSELIAMKMTCCFNHILSHGRPFFPLCIGLLLWIYIRRLTRKLNLFWFALWGPGNIHAYSSCYSKVQVRWFLMFPDDKLH